MTDALLRDLARAKAIFQQRTIVAHLTAAPNGTTGAPDFHHDAIEAATMREILGRVCSFHHETPISREVQHDHV